MIGSYEERKGHEFLFRCMSYVYDKYNDISIVLIGTGNPQEIKKVSESADHYLKGSISSLLGKLENASSYLKDSDLIVIPSQSDESFGLTAVEAMYNGVAIVSTNIGWITRNYWQKMGNAVSVLMQITIVC